MDYIGHKCPVCDKYFHADDDVVVCPDCGTPHHRDCWESVGHCHNEALHDNGFDYAESDTNPESDVLYCRSCGKANDKDAFFCKYCAAPMSKQDERAAQGQNPGAMPGGMPGGIPRGNTGPYPFMDPMAGVPGDTDMGDDVTAGEMAKYVKQNTPYFIRVFNNIKEFNRSKFNFCAAIFCGGYMLYRKMYKLGAFVTALQAAMIIFSTCIQIFFDPQIQQIRDEVLASTQGYYGFSSVTTYMEFFNRLASANFLYVMPTILTLLLLVLRIVVGATFNRQYFKHCKLQIIRTKLDVEESGENAETVLQTRGGVNMPLAISLLVTYLLISYLPNIIIGLF